MVWRTAASAFDKWRRKPDPLHPGMIPDGFDKNYVHPDLNPKKPDGGGASVGVEFEIKFEDLYRWFGGGSGGNGKPPVPPTNDTNNKPKYKGDNMAKRNRKSGNETVTSSGNPAMLGGKANWPLDMSDGKSIGGINTGIRSGLTSLTIQPHDATGGYSPLWMRSMEFNVTGYYDGTNESLARQTWREIVYPLYTQYVQENLNFKSTLVYDDFVTYFNTIAEALQVYYTIEPFVSYSQNTKNQNLHIEHLRNEINANVLDKFFLLRERIEQCVFPPNALKMIYWLYQFYSFGTAPGSSVLKNSFANILQPGNTQNTVDRNSRLGSNMLQSYIDSLFTFTENGTGAIMRQVFNKWQINTLPQSQPTVTYDAQFLTYWCNSTLKFQNATTGNPTNAYYIPSLTTFATVGDYISYVNELDGAIVALWDPYITSMEQCGNGFISPPLLWNATIFPAVNYMSNIYYVEPSLSGGANLFTENPQFTQEFVNSGIGKYVTGENSAFSAATAQIANPPGVQKVWRVSVEQTDQATIDMVRWLYHVLEFNRR